MIRVGILGASGYAGADLMRLIHQRDDLELVFADSKEYGGQRVSLYYPNLEKFNDMDFTSLDIDDNEYFDEIDVLFCGLPHGLTQTTVKSALKRQGLRIIDLSADFRLRDKDIYERCYQTDHTAPEELEIAVYGMSEIYRDRIRDARLVANPGCYPTSITLGLYPLFKEGHCPDMVISDSKSGLSGAGRGLKDQNMFGQAGENMKAYSIGSHRHTPEIKQELSLASAKDFDLLFTPHLVPMQRGILSTIYLKNIDKLTRDDILSIYNEYYKDEYFIRILDHSLPQTKSVAGSNFIDIGFEVDEKTNHIVVVSAIDNLMKGAAGQAMQNMNIMFGLGETKGLEQIALWP